MIVVRSRPVSVLLLVAVLLFAALPLPPSPVAAAEAVLIDDDAHSLSAAGWTRQHAPRAGSYITDAPNSLGNPELIPMKPVIAGQYVFYSSKKGLSNSLKKSVDLGTERWAIEFEARMADLITPAANPVWNGFSVDTIAGGKRYKVSFNSKTGDTASTVKVMIMKNSASAYDETIVALGDFAEIHKWGIEYDGGTTLTVTLDGRMVARSIGIQVPAGLRDQALLYTSTTNLQTGTNEVYLYNYKLIKGGSLRYSEPLLNDEAASLASEGWTTSVPASGQYIIDNGVTPGNPNAVALKPVPRGQYLVYGDGSASSAAPAVISRNLKIGTGSWTLQFKARIKDLIQPFANDSMSGVEVVAGQRKFMVAFQSGGRVVAAKADDTISYSLAQVELPTDDQFHNWMLVHDGQDRLILGLDDRRVATFSGMGFPTAAAEGIRILNQAPNGAGGITEVYVDSLRLTKDTMPYWASIQSDAYSVEHSVNVLTDYGERLVNNKWVRSAAPVSGQYITDFSNSLGNPNQVGLLPVPQDHYLFFASASGAASSITKSPVTIGSGPWMVQLDARFADLITPSAQPTANGFTLEVYAGAKQYKVAFNSMDGNGSFKVLVLKDGSGAYEEIAIPALSPGVHKWAIGYDGGTTVTVLLDGAVIARVNGVTVPDAAPDRIVLGNVAQALASGTNEVYVSFLKLDKTNVPAWVFAAIEDDASNLSASGWTRSLPPSTGNYITDAVDSLGNPNQVAMKPVPPGELLFYSSQNGAYSSIGKSAHIGAGPWYAQLEARIADLPTPSANAAWRGFTVDIFANSKRYRVAFNSLDANGKIKIYVLKAGNTYEMKQVDLPAGGGFHRWGLSFDGNTSITVDLDGKQVAKFSNVNVADSTPDTMRLYADTNNLASGTTEVYVDAIRLLRSYTPTLYVPNLPQTALLTDSAASLSAAGWTSTTPPRTGVYMVDSTASLGNPNGVALKPVPAGQYLIYGDAASASGQYSSVKRSMAIGASAWTLRFDAKIASLAKVTGYYLWKGIAFNVYANKKRYMVSMNNYNAATGTIKVYLIAKDTNTFVEQEVTLPTDGAFHKWEIVYDGTGNLYLGLDDNLIAQSNNAGVADTSADNVTINNLAKDVYTSGTNEVYLDQIVLTRNLIPDWVAYYPSISGVTVKPEAGSNNVPLVVNIAGADPAWFTDPNIAVQARIYREGQLISTGTHPLDASTVSLNVYAGGGSGVHQLDVQLLNRGLTVDKAVRELELYPSVSAVLPEDSLLSVPGAISLFTSVDQMKNASGQSATAAGWQKAEYKYKGMEESVSSNVYTLIENTAGASALTLPVDLHGWFGVYVGYASGSEQLQIDAGSGPRTILLDGGGSPGTTERYSEQTQYEQFAVAANFDGRTLHLLPVAGQTARIAYVKLRGLSPAEIATYTAPDEGPLGRRAIYNNDGYTHFSSLKYNNAAALSRKAVTDFAGLDVGGIDWALGTTMQLNYDSHYAGAPFGSFDENDPTLRELDLFAKDMIHNIHTESGKWAPELLAQSAAASGIDFVLSLRMNAFYSPTSFPALNGHAYTDYVGPPAENESRQLDANNNRTYRLSFFYPRFRDYLLHVLTEASAFPYVDGVNLDFGRYPYIFGNELTDVPSRKEIVTQFLGEVRAALPGKTISVRIPYLNYEGYGFDPQTWIQQGLIDTLIPSNLSYEDFFDIAPFVSMTAGTPVKLYAGIVADLSGTDLTKEQEAILRNGGTVENRKTSLTRTQYQKRTYDAYAAGADGVYIFNDWWNAKGIAGLLGDKVKVSQWHQFAYRSQLVANPIFILH